MTKREYILRKFEQRCQEILLANGFATDAGKTVLIGELPTFGPEDEDGAIVILPAEDEVRYVGENIQSRWPIQISAVVSIGMAHAWVKIEQIIGDIKKAVELPSEAQRTLDGTLAVRFERGATVPLPREDGSDIIGVGVFYICPFHEPWGGGELVAS